MTLRELSKLKPVVLFDGATGTEYQRRGLAAGSPSESWNLTHPQIVKKVHLSYLAAGASVITTNTFGANRMRLRASGLEDKIAEINKIGSDLALTAADGKAVVAGSVSPLGTLIEPYGELSQAEAAGIFQEQIRLLLGCGVRFIAIETMISLEEAVIALKAAKESGAEEVSVSMSFESTPQGPRTPFGESPVQVAQTLAGEGADLVGSNCGQGFDLMLAVATEMKNVATVPLLIQPNAGLPVVDSKGIHYPESPDSFARFVGEMIAMGIVFVGGCCGTTPAHIAMAATLIRKKDVKMNLPTILPVERT